MNFCAVCNLPTRWRNADNMCWRCVPSKEIDRERSQASVDRPSTRVPVRISESVRTDEGRKSDCLVNPQRVSREGDMVNDVRTPMGST